MLQLRAVAELSNDLRKLLRLFRGRQMTAVAEDDQARARNAIAQTNAVAERHVRIGFTPDNQRGHANRIRFA